MKATSTARCRELVTLLTEFEELYANLGSLLEQKLAAIRMASSDRIRELDEQQRALTQRISEREGLRRQLLNTIGAEWGMGAKAGRLLTVSRIAERLSVGERAPLLDIVVRLKKAVEGVERWNRTIDTVSRALLRHMAFVFQAVRSSSDDAGYRPDGTVAGPTVARLVDAVG